MERPRRPHEPATYGLDEHARRRGSGENLLRTESFAQPRALREGDVLATGETVLAPPQEGFNGGVILKIEGGRNGHEIRLPARIPVALRVEESPAEAMEPQRMFGNHIREAIATIRAFRQSRRTEP